MLSAVLAMAVAAPLTWYLAVRTAPEAATLPPVPSGPADRDELREQLLAQLPDSAADGAVLLDIPRDHGAAVGLPPGRHRVHLICGVMRVQGDAVHEVRVHLQTAQQIWVIDMPCPSTALSPDEVLDLTGLPASAVVANLEYDGGPPVGFVLLLQLVPVTGQAGGADE
jgi:hypothetical protein